jgi:uncharacterized protein
MSEQNQPTTRARWIAAGTREPVMFVVDGQRLIGVFHSPRDRSGPVPAVAIFHGFVGSKDQPHQIFVKISEALAAAGVASLRIDFRGRGDSEGETADFTYQSDMADARAALDYLSVRHEVDPSQLGVLGLSWGATIAACLAGEDPRVGRAALIAGASSIAHWNPPTREVDGRQVFEIFCNLVGAGFYASIRDVRPLEIISRARGPVLVAHGEGDTDVPVTESQRFVEAISDAGIPHELAIIPEADHVFMRYGWERALIDRVVAFWRSQP